jgi:hypothetical protein
MGEYKKTAEYRNYQEYLAHFKERHAKDGLTTAPGNTRGGVKENEAIVSLPAQSSGEDSAAAFEDLRRTPSPLNRKRQRQSGPSTPSDLSLPAQGTRLLPPMSLGSTQQPSPTTTSATGPLMTQPPLDPTHPPSRRPSMSHTSAPVRPNTAGSSGTGTGTTNLVPSPPPAHSASALTSESLNFSATLSSQHHVSASQHPSSHHRSTLPPSPDALKQRRDLPAPSKANAPPVAGGHAFP